MAEEQVVKYSIGNIFQRKLNGMNFPYLLASADNDKIALVCIVTGARVAESVSIASTLSITAEEVRAAMGTCADDFEYTDRSFAFWLKRYDKAMLT